MKYDNYIFDLYGTLVDIHTDEESIGFWRKVAGYVKREFGISFKPSELRKLYREIYRDEVEKLARKLDAEHPEIRVSWVWERILFGDIKNPNDGPMDTPSPEIQKVCTFFRETSRDKMELYRDTEKFLEKLKFEGKRVYLLSNAQRSFTWKEIEQLGLDKYFDDIFISSDKMIMKPEKRFLQMLIDKHKLKKEKCVMIGNEIASDGKVAKVNDIDGVIIKDGDFSKIF